VHELVKPVCRFEASTVYFFLEHLMKRNLSWTLLIIFICVITLPYVFAQVSVGDQNVFGGFLLNPKDGNSYLAKMMEGWNGAWQFTLPYTAEQGRGAYLFLFYLFLGHFSRLTGISLMWMFHLARILGAIFLFFSLSSFANWIFPHAPKDASIAFRLSLLGSGLGWLLVGFGLITSDLWVAEAYPFLSSFATPHFCVGMGLVIQLFLNFTRPVTLKRLIGLAIAGLLLAVIMPFGIAVAGLVGLVWLGWEWVKTKCLHWQNFIAAFFLGGPCLLYQYWVIQQDSLLSAWNTQNLTPSPLVWDLFISFSPALILAGWGVWKALHRVEQTEGLRLLMAWCVVGLLMIYFPFSLQRRFMFAYFVPVAFLAVVGLQEIPSLKIKFRKRLAALLFYASILTNLVVILLAVFGVLSHSSLIYLSQDEVKAFEYIRSNTPADAIILCSPDTGNLIPAWTGRRVLYGHEFETVQASENKALVIQLLHDEISQNQALSELKQHHVQFILVSPEAEGRSPTFVPAYLSSFRKVYENNTIQIFTW
jgi:hypothetical protein